MALRISRSGAFSKLAYIGLVLLIAVYKYVSYIPVLRKLEKSKAAFKMQLNYPVGHQFVQIFLYKS